MMSAPTFGKLDTQVQKVVARVRKLERENEKLRQKAARLEKSLEEAPSAGAEGACFVCGLVLRTKTPRAFEHGLSWAP